jgi:hypothetical protein
VLFSTSAIPGVTSESLQRQATVKCVLHHSRNCPLAILAQISKELFDLQRIEAAKKRYKAMKESLNLPTASPKYRPMPAKEDLVTANEGSHDGAESTTPKFNEPSRLVRAILMKNVSLFFGEKRGW